MKSEKIFVMWICDKNNCLADNCREIGFDEIIVEDECSTCGRYIQEPIVKKITDSDWLNISEDEFIKNKPNKKNKNGKHKEK